MGSPSVSALEAFDTLHVISDLHLGGALGQEIFVEGPRLAGFVRRCADEAATKRVALALAGDIVDFIAGPDAKPLSPAWAEKQLRWLTAAQLAPDALVAPLPEVFEALRAFTAKPHATLVLVLGNHDLELALPGPREALLAACCDDAAALGRVRLALDGAGWSCTVGGRRVYVTHGNEWDDWNLASHEGLRELATDLRRGGDGDLWVDEHWRGNAGTKLVLELINPMKKKYPALDLLKPEGAGLVAILAALAPDSVTADRVKAFLASDAVRRVGSLRRAVSATGRRYGLLESAGIEASDAPVEAGDVLDEGDVLESLREGYARKTPPRAMADADRARGAWDRGGTRVAPRVGADPEPALRRALTEWKAARGVFEVAADDDVFEAMNAAVAHDVHVMIAGHTHLPRIRLRDPAGPSRYYLNTGTWIRLLEIPRGALESDEGFRKVRDALTSSDRRKLEALDAHDHRNVVASVRADGASTHVELWRVERPDGTGGVTLGGPFTVDA